MSPHEAASAFRAAMREAGIETDDAVLADGRLHRVHLRGDKRGSRNGWYTLHLDNLAAGAFGCWRRGVRHTWCESPNGRQTTQEREEFRAWIEKNSRERHEKETKRSEDAARTAERLWGEAETANPMHPYLAAKKVWPHGIRQIGERLVLAVRDADGAWRGLQFIDAEGGKRFLSGTKVTGAYYRIGPKHMAGTIVVCEGYATGASIHEATLLPVAVAFDAGNLPAVARGLRTKHPDAAIIIAADNDASGTGQRKAKEAAAAVGAYIAIPEETGKDWNDVGRAADTHDGLKAAFDALILNGEAPPAPSDSPAEEAGAGQDDAAGTGKQGSAASRPIVLQRLLEGEPPAPPKMQVDQLLLAGDVNVLGGCGDAGKSTAAFAAVIATVLGRPLFGSLDIKQQGPVVLVVPEDGRAVARHHIDALIAGMEDPISDAERAALVRDIHIVGDDQRINLLTDTARLAAAIADIRPVLAILDPISSLIGGEDENAEHVAQTVCDNLRRDICRPLGAAALLAGHLRKPGRDTGDVVSVHDLKGSAGWANHARIVWLVSKPKGGSLITFRLAKSNRLQTGTEHQVTLAIEANPDNKAHWLTCRLTDANLGSNSQSFTPGIGRAVNDNEKKALAALDDRQEPGLRLSYSSWHSRSGITSPSTFRNIRERLIDANLAVALPTGKKTRQGSPEYAYEITDGGRNALKTGWKNV